jgi:single-strand DNA-binding protein
MAKQGINQVLLVGHVGQPIVVRYTQGGKATCIVAVATNETYRDKATNKPVTHTEWHRVRLYGRLAEVAGEFVSVGDEVLFQGKNQTRKFERDGRTNYMHEVIADRLHMFGGRKAGEEVVGAPDDMPPAPRTVIEQMAQLDDDEWPF